MQVKINFEEHRKWLLSNKLIQKLNLSFNSVKKRIKNYLFGPSSEFFVASTNYPNIWFGPGVGLENSVSIKDLYGSDYETIIKARSLLLYGKKYGNVQPSGHFIEKSQEIAMSVKPVDVEIKFTRTPKLEMNFSPITQPRGAGTPMEYLKIVDNAKIPKKVDEVVEEKLKAQEGIKELFNYGFDNYYLTTVLSAGILGQSKKKIVPTRWSITAIDDMLAKNMMEQIREYEEIEGVLVFSNEYLFNHFEILIIPGNWEFENFEAWAPNTSWGFASEKPTILEEYEPFYGRTDYAKKQAGGYYASRIGVCEYLCSIKKQARVIVFREISEGYQIPVGVWEVRENVRHAFKNTPKKFSTIKEAIEHLKTKLRVPFNEYLKCSKVIAQTRLTQWV